MHVVARLLIPDPVEKQRPEFAGSRRIFLPLLAAPLAHPMGEGSGVRATESGEGSGPSSAVALLRRMEVKADQLL